MIVDLQISNQSRYSVDEQRLFGVVVSRLEREFSELIHPGSGTQVEISLLFVDESRMAEFNWQYHDTEGPTDVLSFPYTDPESQVNGDVFITPEPAGTILGDIIVCYPVAAKEAEKKGKTVQEMVDFYVDHGLQHLLGHHHE